MHVLQYKLNFRHRQVYFARWTLGD